MSNILAYIRPYLALFNLALMLSLIYACKRYWLPILRQIKRNEWILLTSIFLISLLLRFFLFKPSHVMYVDEFWYMKAAKDILIRGQALWYQKSIGWPAFLAVIFSLFGIENLAAIYTNIILGLITPFNLFLIAFCIFKNKNAGLFSAAVFSFIPAHMFWSATAETSSFSIFFLTLSIFICLLYYENRNHLLLWASLISISFVAQCRPENYCYYILFLVGIIILIRPLPKLTIRFLLPWAVSIGLCLPDSILTLRFYQSNNWLAQGAYGISGGSNFSIGNLIHNSLHWGKHLFGGSLHPLLFSVLFTTGILYCLKHFKKYALYLLSWFAFLYLIYFSAWFQNLGCTKELRAKERLYLSFYPVMIIFASASFYGLKEIITKKKRMILSQIFLLILLLAWFGFYMQSRRDPLKELQVKALTELKRYASEADIIITPLPVIVEATSNLKAYSVKDFLRLNSFNKKIFRQTGKVLFFEDFSCSLPEMNEYCESVKNDYKTTLYHSFIPEERALAENKECRIRLYQIHAQ